MDDLFDRFLLSPTVGQVEEAIQQAAAHNSEARRLATAIEEDWLGHSPRPWESTPEGHEQHEEDHPEYGGGTYFVTLAWWTDRAGRLHVRVTAGDSATGPLPTSFSRLSSEAPSLYRIYPDRLYRRLQAGEEPVWLAACACGMVGTPAQLGWMGERCGPCHDRREEGGPVPGERLAAINELPNRAVALSPDGGTVAISWEGRMVRVYDLETGACRTCFGGDDGEPVVGLAFSPDGRWLAGGDLRMECLKVMDPWTESWADEDLYSEEGIETITGVAFSPNGTTLVAVAEEGVEVWQVAEVVKDWKSLAVFPRATAAAYSPDGRLLALGYETGRVQLLETAGWKEIRRFETGALGTERVRFLAYTPDGQRLVIATGPGEPSPDRRRGQLRVWDLQRRFEIRYANSPWLSAAVLTPDGRYLAYLSMDETVSPAAIHFWDTESAQEVILDADADDLLYDVAFSADGETMATASESGRVRIWPWRALLAWEGEG